MTYELDEALNFKHATDDLIKAIKDNILNSNENNEIEHLKFQFKDETYFVILVKEELISNNSGASYYQLIKTKTVPLNWTSEETIITKYDIQFYVPWYRTEHKYIWNYYYSMPIIQKIKIIDVPKKVIPAHKEIILENI